MSLALPILILIVSLAVLLFASDKVIDAASLLADRMNVSKMAIGLTIVAVGTSLPETAASVAAALTNHPQIAVGNVIGSNICNIGLIIGLPALFAPVVCRRAVLQREGYIMIVVSILVWTLATELGTIGQLTGAFAIVTFGLFILWAIKAGGKEKALDEVPNRTEGELATTTGAIILKLFVSFVLVIVASKFLVNSAVDLARALDVSESVIALSLIALGTSLPELSVSFSAIRKSEGDLLVGNIIGSNISNILLVLGITAIITPFDIEPTSMKFDLPIMIATAIMLVAFLWKPGGIGRIKGSILLLTYAAFLYRCIAMPL